ncbi:MAG: phosphatidylinositol-3-phosphatase [Bradyrhizobium sp.]|jgi:hypothetical protein|nr:phosphatidylinositol-3-phosphatase [Bradyrhizobium sp.]
MKNPMRLLAAIAPLLFMPQQAEAASAIKTVIVIAMENTDADEIYDKKADAPYINGTLMPIAARASNFNDPLPHEIPSEPHYLWMEAGTNAFDDITFMDDDDPGPRKVKDQTGKNQVVKNSTSSTEHLATQLNGAWMSYQEGISANRCPIKSFGFYAAKHNPFVFFEDVSGNPPDRKNQFCIDHHKPYSEFAADLAAGRLANYVFITPNLCHDMHGNKNCSKDAKPVNRIKAGDDWLKAELPRIIKWVNDNAGVIFIIWDEGHKKQKLPFFAIGPGVKPGHDSAVAFDHGSLIRSVEEIFNLPILPKVSQNNNFADLFTPNSFP